MKKKTKKSKRPQRSYDSTRPTAKASPKPAAAAATDAPVPSTTPEFKAGRDL